MFGIRERKPLTVNEMLEILTELKQKGHGDKVILVGYDSNIMGTCPLPDYDIREDDIAFDGDS